MADPSAFLLQTGTRRKWVRLRTLIMLRWLAIAGQMSAIVFASFYLGMRINLGLCLLAIGASVISNLIAVFVYPENKRLGERDVLLTLLFDLCQLAFLLYLTGGLNNPFALLILAPVTIAATALRLRDTVFLGAMAIVLISIVALWNEPLRDAQGYILLMPRIFLYGFWIALVIGVVFLAAYARRVTMEMHSMSQALLATQMALSREQNLTNLGGVVAAAAHELGTPLATIKLTSAELAEELADRPDLREDVELIRDQADRCRDIMRSMGRAGKDDLHTRHAPLEEVIREAAEPHSGRGVELIFQIGPDRGGDSEQPEIWRRPEIIHGLRNLVQNAVDFAHARVWVDAQWSDEKISIRVADDGRGYPPDMLGRIGDPFLRRRKHGSARAEERPGYEGMGLGLFIAKTLLERSGAEVSFANGSDPFLAPTERPERSGAIVEVVWPRAGIALAPGDGRAALGENQPIRV
ncbi:two-component sensor histidine kinase [Maritimibacter sp. 55A14]|uniref:sensor histidine kinase RegB n=1 Tax=Maritimibacter sp. 55A14 TaxID=2174844 RepID=UPI000D61DF3B|nr:ActS/PrrB/RegB family redox-sensitive histidine kinase [Maritimibacter sp. 55A14]PWE33472.1 two-component sensor histidine kinase [Maritimibacter sp. 55A14]